MTDELRAAANKKAREEKKKAALHAMLVRHAEQFRAFETEHSQSIAHRVHDAMDDVLERDRSKDRSSREIKCGKGCHHCCKGPVEVFPHEAALLVKVARESGFALDIARLRRQSQYGIDNWREQGAADKACVFLGDDGTCKIYASRPNACRKLLVVTEPALCDAEKYDAGSVGRWISWEAEILGVAALEVFGAALMPTALLAALQGEEVSPR